MTLEALKCPNCGATVSRDSMNCAYCGAGITIAQDGLHFLPHKQAACPKCGNTIVEDAWFCVNCGQVTTKDVQHLKQVQKKIVFEQSCLKEVLAEINGRLEPNEFVYYVINSDYSKDCVAVTDKKLINYQHKRYWNALLSEIVAVREPENDGYKNTMTVQTLNGNETLNLGCADSWRLRSALVQALDDWTYQRTLGHKSFSF